MTETNPQTRTANDIRTLKLICLALAGGTAVLAAVAAGLTLAKIAPGGNIGNSQASGQSIGWMLLGLTVVVGFSQAMAWPFIRMGAIRNATKVWAGPGGVDVRERKLWGQYGSLCIVRCALAEGVGILGIVTLFVGGLWWGLIAPAIAILFILAALPSQSGYERFLTDATRSS